MGILILLYVPVVRDYLAFGSMRLVDWMFPLGAGVVYLIARELKKMWNRHRSPKQIITVEATVSPTINI